MLALDWQGPVEAQPGDTLRARPDHFGDAALRNEAIGVLDALCRARDAVTAAAGGAHQLATTLDVLNEVFVAATGAAAIRRQRQNYAVRTLVYEDTIRAVEVELGKLLRDALAAPPWR
ncbi:hypothetical protein ACWDSD_44005 [Streptomyces spiralis]